MRGISMNSDGARGCEFCLTDRGRGHNMIAVEGRGWVCDVCGWKPLDADRECQREPDEVEQGGAWVLRGRGIRASRKRYARPALLELCRRLRCETQLALSARAERRLAAWILDRWAIPYRTIADATGLSMSRVGQIVAEARVYGRRTGLPLAFPPGRRELLDAWRAWSRGS